MKLLRFVFPGALVGFNLELVFPCEFFDALASLALECSLVFSVTFSTFVLALDLSIDDAVTSFICVVPTEFTFAVFKFDVP